MLKKLLANVGEYKKQSLQTPLFTMGEVLMDVIMPLIMAGLIDNGIEKSDTNAILRYGGLLFLCALLRSLQRDLRRIFAIIYLSESKVFLFLTLIVFRVRV